MTNITYSEARDAAIEMVQLTDLPVFLMADTRTPDGGGAVLVRLQDDLTREEWIPSFMCEIMPCARSPGTCTRTLTAARKVLEWRSLL